MDAKKLDKWADLLLDTGKRNNLINFKDLRASTVEVLHLHLMFYSKFLTVQHQLKYLIQKVLRKIMNLMRLIMSGLSKPNLIRQKKSNYFWQNIQVRLRVKTKF